jgi:hypothetical protein
MSFTSVCLACFRLGIMSSLKTREQSARSALPKIDPNPSLCPSGGLLKSLFRTL